MSSQEKLPEERADMLSEVADDQFPASENTPEESRFSLVAGAVSLAAGVAALLLVVWSSIDRTAQLSVWLQTYGTAILLALYVAVVAASVGLSYRILRFKSEGCWTRSLIGLGGLAYVIAAIPLILVMYYDIPYDEDLSEMYGSLSTLPVSCFLGIGTLLFGLMCLSSQPLSRFNGVPLLFVMVLFLPAVFDMTNSARLPVQAFVLAFAAAAVCWLLVAVQLILDSRPRASSKRIV